MNLEEKHCGDLRSGWWLVAAGEKQSGEYWNAYCVDLSNLDSGGATRFGSWRRDHDDDRIKGRLIPFPCS
jgi:hypothetical protein